MKTRAAIGRQRWQENSTARATEQGIDFRAGNGVGALTLSIEKVLLIGTGLRPPGADG